jgi:hypothetical protein
MQERYKFRKVYALLLMLWVDLYQTVEIFTETSASTTYVCGTFLAGNDFLRHLHNAVNRPELTSHIRTIYSAVVYCNMTHSVKLSLNEECKYLLYTILVR